MSLYFAGAKQISTYPVSIPYHGMGLNITLQSYNGYLDFGVISCQKLMPDIHELAQHMKDAHNELLELSLKSNPEAEKLALVKEAPKADTYATGSASQAAKKVLAEKGMSASDVKGTGKDGRITKDDAVNATPSMGTPSTGGARGSERKKLSMLRRKVAERLVSVKNETAMLTTFNEVDMQPIFDLRNSYKEDFKAKHGVGLGFMSFFTKAVTRALQMYPDVNSMIDGDFKISYDFQDILYC